MPENIPFPRHAASQVLLRASLFLGAAMNASLGILLLLAPHASARWLGVVLPSEPLVLWWFSLSLLLFAAFILLPVYDLVAYSGNIAIAILGRLVAGAILLVVAQGRPDSGTILWVAAVEFCFAVAQAGLWLPFRRSPLL
jgi:hypothetical protein